MTARKLLRGHLNKEQKAQLVKYGGFLVVSELRNRYFVSSRALVRFKANGLESHRFCMLALDEGRMPLPPSDAMLVQKLLLETNEKLFLSTARVTEVRRAHFVLNAEGNAGVQPAQCIDENAEVLSL